MDGIIDLVLTSRAEAPVTKFDVLAKQNSDLLSCVLLINNRHANKNKANKKKRALSYCTKDRTPCKYSYEMLGRGKQVQTMYNHHGGWSQ